jgi:hypothetical protein
MVAVVKHIGFQRILVSQAQNSLGFVLARRYQESKKSFPYVFFIRIFGVIIYIVGCIHTGMASALTIF